MHAKESCLVQQLLVVADEHAGVFGGSRALAHQRDDLARTAHRLVIGDAGEIAAHYLRQRPDRTERADLHEPSRLQVAPARGRFATVERSAAAGPVAPGWCIKVM